MGSFFILPNNGYGTDTLMFAVSVVFLALPLAALILASLLDGPMRERGGRRHLSPAPLSLRHSIASDPKKTRRTTVATSP